MKETLLRTEKLSKSFSNGGAMQHVLKNIDLQLYKGDFTVIMGASGAGKCLVRNGHAYAWQDYFRRSGYFRVVPGWACRVPARPLWFRVPTDLSDRRNERDG